MTVPLVDPFPLLYVLIEKHPEGNSECDEAREMIPRFRIYQVSELGVESWARPSFVYKDLEADHSCTDNRQNYHEWVAYVGVFLYYING